MGFTANCSEPLLSVVTRGSLIKTKEHWSMDHLDQDGMVVWDERDCEIGERFIVLSKPFWLSKTYMGAILHGPAGIELFTCAVVNAKAFTETMDSIFEEIK